MGKIIKWSIYWLVVVVVCSLIQRFLGDGPLVMSVLGIILIFILFTFYI